MLFAPSKQLRRIFAFLSREDCVTLQTLRRGARRDHLEGITEIMANLKKLALWAAIALVGAAAIAASYYERYQADHQFAAEVSQARDEAQRIEHEFVRFTRRTLPSGGTFAAFLNGLGIDSPTASRMVASAQPVFDMRHLRAGNELSIGRSVLGEIREVRYNIEPGRVLSIEPTGSEFHSTIETIPSHTDEVGVVGQVDGSLFQAVTDAGEKPELAMRLAEIFAYDLDFYTDPRPGDTFRMVVEKKVLENGQTVAYGRILAAEYNNAGRAYRAVLFRGPTGMPTYYTPDGKSTKKAFLHSPLKFAAPITSHFSLHRFHPILKEYRAHLGIDYGAPTGTPVQSIGDGNIVFAGRKGGDGNLVKVQHANGYTTYYMHLSRILVRNGQRVAQGQSIGLVGMTGLATGPHLDFRIQLRGEFLNFEKLALPPSDPVSRRDWNEFAAARDRALAEMPPLPGGHAALAQNQAPPSASAAR
jgi:murein DD-endopeptidase MepM/ murein hydrolase activator NlpD